MKCQILFSVRIYKKYFKCIVCYLLPRSAFFVTFYILSNSICWKHISFYYERGQPLSFDHSYFYLRKENKNVLKQIFLTCSYFILI